MAHIFYDRGSFKAFFDRDLRDFTIRISVLFKEFLDFSESFFNAFFVFDAFLVSYDKRIQELFDLW